VTLLVESVYEGNCNPLANGSVALQAGQKSIQFSIILIDLKKIPVTDMSWRDFSVR
jgi:hypothetical protein